MISKVLCLTRDDPKVSHLSQVQALIEGGARFIQLRTKVLPVKERFDQATQSLKLCRMSQTKMIVNDHLQLAAQIGADGVHLGQTDGSVEQARDLLDPGTLVGRTVHSMKEAKSVKLEKPDYVGIGPYRASRTKQCLKPVLHDEEFRKIATYLMPIPVYLIGGLSYLDFPLIKKLGVFGLALCSSLFSNNSITNNTNLALRAFGEFPPAGTLVN